MGAGSSTALRNVRVVVIGGGYAGTAVVKGLDAKVSVTLIEKKDAFFHNIAAPRALVEDIDSKIFIPYKRILKRGRHVQGEVTAVNAAVQTVQVRLADGTTQEVLYDFLVLATGTAFTSPLGPHSTVATESKAQIRASREAIRTAESVVVVGGGPAGVEIAGELKTDFPAKTVTLVHNGSKLLSADRNGNISDQFRGRVLTSLREMGVVVQLNERAELPETLPAGATRNGDVIIGKTTIRLATSGTTIAPDVTIFCSGGRPNTGFLSEHADLLDGEARLKVGAFLQLQGHDRIFALGDIVNTPEGKTAYIASKLQAPVLIKNVLKLAKLQVAGKAIANTKLATYKPKTSGAMLVTLGRRRGAGQLGSSLFGDWFVRTIKGGDMLVKSTNSDFGYKPGQYPDTGAATAKVAAGTAATAKVDADAKVVANSAVPAKADADAEATAKVDPNVEDAAKVIPAVAT